MCEIFPEVNNCCYFFSIRIGMIFIAVLSIVTGGIGMSALLQNTKASYDTLKGIADIRNPSHAMSHLTNVVQSGITLMFTLFMLMGVLLLIANFSDQEGLVQVFVWVIFLNIVIGFTLLLASGLECLMKTTCIFGNMDWLSSATAVVTMIFYLIAWIYFISVCNSYVLNG